VFDAGILPHVTRALHRTYPGKPVIITGDNDLHLEAALGINPGKEKAREAADATGGTVVLPIFAPGERERDPRGFTDFNDLTHRSVLGRYGIAHQVNLAVDAVLAQQRQVPYPGKRD
jgi:putative DNA primase/helicase